MSKKAEFPHQQPFNLNGRPNTKRNAWYKIGNNNNNNNSKKKEA